MERPGPTGPGLSPFAEGALSGFADPTADCETRPDRLIDADGTRLVSQKIPNGERTLHPGELIVAALAREIITLNQQLADLDALINQNFRTL